MLTFHLLNLGTSILVLDVYTTLQTLRPSPGSSQYQFGILDLSGFQTVYGNPLLQCKFSSALSNQQGMGRVSLEQTFSDVSVTPLLQG